MMNGENGSPMDDGQPGVKLSWFYDDVKCVNDDDKIDVYQFSCLQYDSFGEFLAVGDRGGKVSIYRMSDKFGKTETPTYEIYCNFTSHESEFDYLKSLEIEEKINKVRWLPQQSQSRHLLTTNDKTIKLWRLTERRKKIQDTHLGREGVVGSSKEAFDETYDETCEQDEEDRIMHSQQHRVHNAGDLRLPRYEEEAMTVEAQPRRVYSNAHAYHINSISVNSDQETFLSSDDLRINLWNLQITDQSFNIVDIKPTNMEELNEVITAAEFHPSTCSLFVYSSSKGILRLCDLRQRALCDDCVVAFHEIEDPSNRGFFSEIINSVTDLKFSNSGRYILSRDYLTLKVWDLKMSGKPVETYQVHDYFKSKFCNLYENDCIFDKFECCWSPNDNYLMTGSYNNLFRVFDRSTGEGALTEVSQDIESLPASPLKTRFVTGDALNRSTDDEISVDCMDLTKKLLYTTWHPTLPRIAMTSGTSIFLASGRVESSL